MELVDFLLRVEVRFFSLGLLAGSYGTIVLTWPRNKDKGRG